MGLWKPCSIDQRNRMFRWVLIHQRELEVRRHGPAIQLGDQRRAIRIQGWMVTFRQFKGVRDLKAIEGIQAQQLQSRFDEAETVDNPDGDTGLSGQGANPGHRRFPHKRGAGHRIADTFRPSTQLQDRVGDPFIYGFQALRFCVDGIEVVNHQVGRQRPHRGMPPGSHIDLLKPL